MASVNYPAIKTALAQWVTDVTGLVTFFEEDSHDFALAPYAVIRLADGGKQGKDYVSHDYEPTTKVVTPRVRGNRQLIAGVTIRSRESVTPRSAVEDLRTSLEHPNHMQKLFDDGGLAFVRVETCQHGIGIHYEERTEAIAVLDVRFALHAELFDATQTTEAVINAGLTNQVKNPDGTLIDPDAAEELVGEDYPYA